MSKAKLFFIAYFLRGGTKSQSGSGSIVGVGTSWHILEKTVGQIGGRRSCGRCGGLVRAVGVLVGWDDWWAVADVGGGQIA